jgi:hypothetical protein
MDMQRNLYFRGLFMHGRLSVSATVFVISVAFVASNGGIAVAVRPPAPAPAPAPAAAPASAAAGKWGKVQRLPGTGADSAVLSLSCSKVGDCTAGGTGFVDTQTRGKWGKARPVPGTSGLDVQWSVSCVSPGNCGSIGNTPDGVYVASQRNGAWGPGEKVPGLGALDPEDSAVLNALSCGAAGFCVAGGSYADGSGHAQAFVVMRKAGVWGKAQRLPGLAALNQGRYASLSAMSCPSAGDCTGGGLYTDRSGAQQAFVVSLAGYRWLPAANLPGLPALNKGAYAQLSAVSCSSAASCGAGGIYTDGGYNDTAFVVSRTKGSWRTSLRLRGINGLSPGPSVGIDQLSCSSAGNCGAGGFYTDAEGRQQAFVAGEAGGKWAAGEAVPGTVAPNTGLSALTASVSCRSQGNCTAGGLYTVVSGHSVVFVVSEVGGVWKAARNIGGVGSYETLYSVSCAAPASCVAGLGARAGSAGNSYVLTETPDR